MKNRLPRPDANHAQGLEGKDPMKTMKTATKRRRRNCTEPAARYATTAWFASMLCLGACLLVILAGCAVEVDGEGGDDGVDSGGDTRDLVDRGAPGKADGSCGPFPTYYYQFLDDTKCVKALPSNRDRELACPTESASATVRTTDGREVTYSPAGAPVEVDASALDGLVPDDLRVTLILVRRVNGVPHYRYLSNGRHNNIVQPWSSTKFMAAANAAARLRTASDYRVGLTGSVDGWPLGDLVTMVHAYDEKHFTSNGLSRYFHDVGGRARAQGLISSWLGRPAGETFGGNYGAPAAGLGFRFEDGDATVQLTRDTATPPENQLSTFTLAEFLKRLVMHREDAATRLPGIQWADVRTLLYGAEHSRLYDANDPQGMEADTAIYLQQAFDVRAMEERTRGQWRVFSKLGHGQSRGGEFVHVGYACLPKLDDAGKPVPEAGKELFLATHLSAGGRLAEGDSRLASIYRTIVGRVLDGQLK